MFDLHGVECFDTAGNARQCGAECLWSTILRWVKHSRVEPQGQAFHSESSIPRVSDPGFSIHAAERAFHAFHAAVKHFTLGQAFHTRSSIPRVEMRSLESDCENS